MYLNMRVKVCLSIPFVLKNNLPSSFRLFSKHLGMTYIERMKNYHRYSTCTAKYQISRNGHIFLTRGKYRGFSPSYLDVVLKRKCVVVNGFSYHMPRYYAEKIFKSEQRLHPLESHSKAKVLVKSPLSVALANRAFDLRCELSEQAFRCHPNEPFKQVVLSEDSTLLRRSYKAQQSLQAFYQRSHF